MVAEHSGLTGKQVVELHALLIMWSGFWDSSRASRILGDSFGTAYATSR